jgi:hypothetical protein
MKTVISFDEGCSGNFLAALLTGSTAVSYNRIDYWSNYNLLKYQLCADLSTENFLKHDVVVTHEHDYNRICQLLKPDRIIRIEPQTGIFNAIYNIYSKKLINEDHPGLIDRWTTNPSVHYDQALEHIKDYYNYFLDSKLTNGEILFDFGWIYNDQDLLNFSNRLGIDIDITFAQAYREKQLPWLLDLPQQKDMESIVGQIPEQYFTMSPWFASYCIFCYEKLNQLGECQRTWSINQVGLLTKSNLIQLAQQYQL